MFGEPERGEPSMFTLWGVPGRMFTGLVGVDMAVGMKKGRTVGRNTKPHVTPSVMTKRRVPCLDV